MIAPALRFAPAVFSAVLLAGCASSGSSPSASSPPAGPTSAAAPSPTRSSNRNVATEEELLQAGDGNVLDALMKLRPAWFRQHEVGRTTALAPIQVYIGGMAMPGLEHLRDMLVRSVVDVTFLPPQQAIARFGGNNTSGAIVVRLK